MVSNHILLVDRNNSNTDNKNHENKAQQQKQKTTIIRPMHDIRQEKRNSRNKGKEPSIRGVATSKRMQQQQHLQSYPYVFIFSFLGLLFVLSFIKNGIGCTITTTTTSKHTNKSCTYCDDNDNHNLLHSYMKGFVAVAFSTTPNRGTSGRRRTTRIQPSQKFHPLQFLQQQHNSTVVLSLSSSVQPELGERGNNMFNDLDPILTNILLDTLTTTTSALDDDDENDDNVYDNDDSLDDDYEEEEEDYNPSRGLYKKKRWDLKDIVEITNGLQIWKNVLLRGRLPIPMDFVVTNSNRYDNKQNKDNHDNNPIHVWPSEPLFTKLNTIMANELQLPRFILRHPEIITSVLVTILRITIDFYNKKELLTEKQQQEDTSTTNNEKEIIRNNNQQYVLDDFYLDSTLASNSDDYIVVEDIDLLQLADEVIATSNFVTQYGNIISGVTSLDHLFGPQHGLLDVQQQQQQQDSGASPGFGLSDGIWHHSGFKILPVLLNQISSMNELRELVKSLGRRPTSENNHNKYDKFKPRIENKDGMLGAMDDSTIRTSVEGLTLSNNLGTMLPSEAILLKGSYPSLRWLFMSKQIESKLLSYKVVGYKDLPSIPKINRRRRNQYLQRMPSAPGGPIIICLDTSWSMSSSGSGGNRELLSKTVVLSCVSIAHKQNRDCIVIAFSNSNGVIESGILNSNKDSIYRLLNFLQNSFGGGTDVTGALKYAIETIRSSSSSTTKSKSRESQKQQQYTATHSGKSSSISSRKRDNITNDNKDSNSNNNSNSNSSSEKGSIIDYSNDDMAAADLLLITDGEIPDPPVSEEMMKQINDFKEKSGMEIYGLLIGKNESIPLDKLCTKTYNFLTKYESNFILSNPVIGSSSSSIIGGARSSSSTPSSWRSTIGTATPTATTTSTSLFGMLPFHQRNRRHNFSSRLASTNNNMNMNMAGIRRNRFPNFRNVVTTHSSTMLNAKQKGKGRRFEDDYDDELLWEETTDGDNDGKSNDSYRKVGKGQPDPTKNLSSSFVVDNEDSYNTRVEGCIQKLVDSVMGTVQEQAWDASVLDKEKERVGSCWQYRNELKAAVQRVSENLIEREEEARLLVIGMISREHILFLGPPGTGKSALGRRLATLCADSNPDGTVPFFQRLLTRFTTPEEIFGPLSLKSLENDEYKRCTTGFLPTASIAFLDEIFKANSAILNTLLTILNERQFDNGAGKREYCPIRCVVGASNELPDSDELDALYDRFLIRKEVLPVSDNGLIQMLSMDTTPGYSPCDDNNGNINSIGSSGDTGKDAKCGVVFSDGLSQVIQSVLAAADTVRISDDLCILLKDLRTYMREELDVEVSDRRLVKAAKLLKVSAASHGRSKVDPIDCLLLQHIVWRFPEQRDEVLEWLWDHLTPGVGNGIGAVNTAVSAAGETAEEEEKERILPPASALAVQQFRFLLDGLRQEAMAAVRKTNGDITGDSGARDVEVAAIDSIRREVTNVAFLLQQRSEALARHTELLRRAMDHLWLDPDQARASQQLLLPRAENIMEDINQTLLNARALEVALSHDNSISPPNDLRLSVIESLWDDSSQGRDIAFTDEELSIGMKEAKAKYDAEIFRMWKRAKKKQSKKR